MPESKRCARCKEEKPLDAFYKNKRMKDGHAQYCRDCQSKAAHEYYVRHSDRVKEKVRAYRERDPEATAEMRRREYARHAEAYRERARQWVRDNPERARENKRRYRQERPDVWRRNNALRRARQKGPAISEVDFGEIMARDRGRCWMCGKVLTDADRQFDHVVPLSKGGEHSTRNIRLACRFCNYSKHDKLITHQTMQF